ncbi:Small protein A [Bartonella clarridgeiae 73]|uniref:Small protein A n=1 Tax=Bartonella clarridgeiae (strain CCUG 45776 / CIP 104772 / 73) TaxID=696125 RepID=E6YI15_BARC7|nr:MAG: Outer membrane beta-barrel assembly protein BamE [Bartonella clarridgeiae]CBI76503.1 Small protein A [Bartonella clarridgeiae 73]
MFQIPHITNLTKRKLLIGLSIVSAMGIAGCNSISSLNSSQIYNSLNSSQIYQEGYILDKNALDSVSVGSSQEQVLLALGSPSLKTHYDNEVFYYISQTRYRKMRFMKTKITDRKVLAIYFNKDRQVIKIANYGLQDGKIFDFITYTTPTGGNDQPFLLQLIKGAPDPNNDPVVNH